MIRQLIFMGFVGSSLLLSAMKLGDKYAGNNVRLLQELCGSTQDDVGSQVLRRRRTGSTYEYCLATIKMYVGKGRDEVSIAIGEKDSDKELVPKDILFVAPGLKYSGARESAHRSTLDCGSFVLVRQDLNSDDFMWALVDQMNEQNYTLNVGSPQRVFVWLAAIFVPVKPKESSQ